MPAPSRVSLDALDLNEPALKKPRALKNETASAAIAITMFMKFP
jgi:hypothetical protein